MIRGLLTAMILLAAGAANAASVIVFGASGQLGAEVIRELSQAGHDVTAFVREGSDLKRIEAYKPKVAKGDAMVEANVEKALKAAKFDVVVDALARGKSDVAFYEETERYISKWAKATGVKQIILHSSVGAGESKAIYPKSRWEAMRPTLEAKEAGENHVIKSGVGYTIIRNAVLRNLDAGTADKAELTEDQKKFGAVTRTGLGRLTKDCILAAKCTNKIFHAVDASVPVPAAAAN